MNVKLFVFVLCWPMAVLAQGFAGLGTTAEGFAVPQRGTELEFPQDHGAHPDFRIEWWYVTANLTGEDGLDYGIQWTLFRSALRPGEASGWQSPQLWMGHAAITTPDTHHVSERMARGGIGQAGAVADPFDVWIDDWQMSGPDFDQVMLSASGLDFSYNLSLSAQGPLVFHGDRGYSVKSEAGQASHYYSQPFYEVTGTLHLPDRSVTVTGHAWLDREWSSQPLAEDQSGWDWFSLSLKDGSKVMAFRLRGNSDFTSGTWITPKGETTALSNGTILVEPLTLTDVKGSDIPTKWRLSIPDKALNVEVTAINSQALMDTTFAYWEGPVTVSGSHVGKGYLEMTGYR